MTRPGPLHYLWWLVSRASGVVALVLITAAVLLGAAMAARLVRPRARRVALRVHEHLALSALGALGLHGVALLGDHWLHPGLAGILVPFATRYRPSLVAAGIVGGYLAALVGPSFYLRRRLGPSRWRRVHRLGSVVWLLAAIHTLGAGTDSERLWLRALVLAPVAPLVYALLVRALAGRQRAGASPRPAGGYD